MSTETIRDTRYEIGVLTGALVKVDAYRYAFPDWTVTHIPSEFSEHEIKYEVKHKGDQNYEMALARSKP